MIQKLNILSRLCHPRNHDDGYKNLWLQVSLNFTDNSPCLNISTVPSKRRWKDNSALLELCQRRSENCASTLTQRNGTFSAITVSSLVPLFSTSCRFHVQTELQITFISRCKSKNRTWRFRKAVFFFAQEEKLKTNWLWADIYVLYGDLKHALFVSRPIGACIDLSYNL